MSPLRFTIVIPNYNGAAALERAIRSVVSQQYSNVQLIIADGGSDDSSHDIIHRYASHFDGIICRKDQGQADALNFAFQRANGDIHAWLCSDDELLPGALVHVADIFAREPHVDVVAGASERVFEERASYVFFVPPDAWRKMTAQNVFDQPSVFWRSALHRRVGALDTSFNLAFDWDFWCRMRSQGARLHVTDCVLSRYYFSGTNKTSVAGVGHVDEGFRIVHRYGPYNGALARAYRALYRHFDLFGCMDRPPSSPRIRYAAYRCCRRALVCLLGKDWIDLYPWHFASLQQRKKTWWSLEGVPTPEIEESVGNAMLSAKG